MIDLKTFNEILAEPADDENGWDIGNSNRCSGWGPWYLRRDNLTLETMYPYEYYIDLERCITRGDILEIILHVTKKGWPDWVIAGLVRAIEDVINPAYVPGRLSNKKIKERVARFDGSHWLSCDGYFEDIA